MATMPCSGSSTSPMPVMMSECSRSATASIASSRRRMRSVRQSLASSTAERIRLPWCLSSLPSKRSNKVNASAVPPAKPARMRSWYRRLTFFAPPLTTTLPSVTWPSPPSATLAPRRTERMVVPWKDSMREKPIWGMKPGYSRLLANRTPYNPGRFRQRGLDGRGLEPHVDARDPTLRDTELAAKAVEGAAEWRARLPQLERHAASGGIDRVALVGGRRERGAYQQDQEQSRHQSLLRGFQGSMRRITLSRSRSAWRRAAPTCSATSEASSATRPMCSALNSSASWRSFETRSGTWNSPNQFTDRPAAEA